MQGITQMSITPRLLKIYKCNQLNKRPCILTLTFPPQPQHHKTNKFRLDNQTDIDNRNVLYIKGQNLYEDSYANQDSVLIHLC